MGRNLYNSSVAQNDCLFPTFVRFQSPLNPTGHATTTWATLLRPLYCGPLLTTTFLPFLSLNHLNFTSTIQFFFFKDGSFFLSLPPFHFLLYTFWDTPASIYSRRVRIQASPLFIFHLSVGNSGRKSIRKALLAKCTYVCM